jgi:hypothetical protein
LVGRVTVIHVVITKQRSVVEITRPRLDLCVSCGEQDAVAGVLCSACAARLCKSPLCPEQIVVEPTSAPAAGLVDCWGRINALPMTPTPVGREPEGLSILDPSVSRKHAIIECRDGKRWEVIDRASSNGTHVDGKRIIGRAPLEPGSSVFFGDVGFLVVSPLPQGRLAAVSHPTWMPEAGPPVLIDDEPDPESETTFSGLCDGRLVLIEHSGGAGGVLELGSTAAQLTLAQFELFRVLRDRMNEDVGSDERVRGFVRSSELLAHLPWDTARAEENHLKQLIRRARRTLSRAGVIDIIEARHGFGYRLRVRTYST